MMMLRFTCGGIAETEHCTGLPPLRKPFADYSHTPSGTETRNLPASHSSQLPDEQYAQQLPPFSSTHSDHHKAAKGTDKSIHLLDRCLDPAHPQPTRASFNTTHTPSGTETRILPTSHSSLQPGEQHAQQFPPHNQFKTGQGRGQTHQLPHHLVQEFNKSEIRLGETYCKDVKRN